MISELETRPDEQRHRRCELTTPTTSSPPPAAAPSETRRTGCDRAARLDASRPAGHLHTVAAEAGVSRSWLYAQDDLRAQIGQLRTRPAGPVIAAGPRPAARTPTPRCYAASKRQPTASASSKQTTANSATHSSARSVSSGSGNPLTSHDTPGKRRTGRSPPAVRRAAGSPVNNTVHDTKPQVRRFQNRRAKDN